MPKTRWLSSEAAASPKILHRWSGRAHSSGDRRAARLKPVSDDPGCQGTDTQIREDWRLRKLGYYFDPAQANRICQFFSRFVYHHKGDWSSPTVKLEPWQRSHLRRLFGWRRPGGTRRYRKTFWLIPRKNGKSTIASGLGLFLMLADGEKGSEVYALAANKEQSSILFDDARRTVKASPELNRINTVFKGTIFHADSGSRFQALSGSPRGKHGSGPYGVLVDELHEFRDRGAFDAMMTGSVAREQPLMCIITTAGEDQNSLCFEEYDYACKVRDDVFQDPHFLPVIYEAGADDDWHDPKVWAKANPNLGVSIKIEKLKELHDQVLRSPGKEPAFRRFHLNQWVQMAKRWLSLRAWDRCRGTELTRAALLEKLRGRRCFGGLDLSKTTDLSAFVLIFPDDAGGYDVLPWFWCPEETIDRRSNEDRVPYRQWAKDGWIIPTPGNVVDYSFIRQRVADLSSAFEVQEVAYDRLYAGELVQALQDQHGLTMVEFGQGFLSMAQPTAELERLVTAARIRHYGHPILRWNTSNAVVRTDPAGNMKPDKGKSTGRIDGLVATIMALGRATVTGGSVYESRPIVTL